MAAEIDVSKMKKLLALDLPQVAVASALGCSEGLVSQYMADASFLAEVSALKLVRLEGQSNRDDALDAIEDKIVEKLKTSVNYMIKPMELLSALKVVNGAQRRGALGSASNIPQLGQVVTVVLPQAMALTYVRNVQGEIIEAGGRSLTTLPSNVLKQMAANNRLDLMEVSDGTGRERKLAC